MKKEIKEISDRLSSNGMIVRHKFRNLGPLTSELVVMTRRNMFELLNLYVSRLNIHYFAQNGFCKQS
jgi:hypothetical protein